MIDQPKALYIHIPFCDHICSYCDFAKVFKSSYNVQKYMGQLIREIGALNIPEDSLKTIYIGGGTPSALSIEEIAPLLTYLNEHFPSTVEFSIESNPESLTEEKILFYKTMGINRISIGVQTSNDVLLKDLNRAHSISQVSDCIDKLHKCHFENFNLDFIYGIPNMTRDDLLNDLNFAISSDAKHLSFYSLQIEEHTAFYNRGIQSQSDETLAEEYKMINDFLRERGYRRYEISNFAKEGYECLHNLTYWRDEYYYAAGISAASYLYSKRYIQTRSLTKYRGTLDTREEETISTETQKLEFLLCNLRLTEGFLLKEYKERFNEDFLEEYKKKLPSIGDDILIEEGRFRIKKEKLYLMDGILLKLL